MSTNIIYLNFIFKGMPIRASVLRGGPPAEDRLSDDRPDCPLYGLASNVICTPFTGQLVKGDFLCAIPMNSKNIALTCIGKGNIRKHLKAFPKGVFA